MNAEQLEKKYAKQQFENDKRFKTDVILAEIAIQLAKIVDALNMLYRK